MSKKIENTAILENLADNGTVDAYIYDADSGLEYSSTTLDNYEITLSKEKEEVKGGRQNNVLYVLDKGITASVKLTDNMLRRDILAIKNGGQIKKGSVNVRHMPKYYTVTGSSSSFTFTLDKEPAVGEIVSVYNPETKKMIVDSKVSVSGKEVTITEELKANQTVYVGGFLSLASSIEYTEIGGAGTAPNVAITLEKELINSETGKVAYIIQYNFFKCAIGGSTTMSGTAEKSKSTNDTEFTPILSPEHGCIGHILYIPVTDTI